MSPDEYRAEEGWKDWKKQEKRIAELEKRLSQARHARDLWKGLYIQAVDDGKKARTEERERFKDIAAALDHYLTEGWIPHLMEYNTQTVNWVHKELKNLSNLSSEETSSDPSSEASAQSPVDDA